MQSIGQDLRSGALTLLATLLFGLLPALQGPQLKLNEMLKAGAHHTTSGRGQQRFRSALIVTEVALAMVPLAGAGLMLKSFWRLTNAAQGSAPPPS
ncbi:MAG: hypothetical protein U0Y68_25560 [Blastocatellia bacterium]